jgi:integrase
MHVWSAEEARAFDAATVGHPLGVAFHLALATGMRRSEVLDVRWRDVDLDRCVVAVRGARVAAGYAVSVGDTKNGRERTITLGPSTVARLRDHQRLQREARLALGLPRATHVVTREDGSLPHPQTLTYYFNRAVAETDLPLVTFHGLRHTHATLLLEAGVNAKVVQERLGHSSIEVTLDIYSHVMPGMQAAAAAALDDVIFGGP